MRALTGDPPKYAKDNLISLDAQTVFSLLDISPSISLARYRNKRRIHLLQSETGVCLRRILGEMARGWESKSVEEQQAAASTTVESKQRLTAEQLARNKQHQTLELCRSHLRQQMQAAQNPRHRQMLENALEDLDRQLARLG
jgi:hypothetical protein